MADSRGHRSMPVPGPGRDRTERILAELRAGDVDAFRKIHERFGPQLLLRARRLLVLNRLDGFHPEDLVQEAWLRISEKAAILTRFRHRGEGSLLAWLYKVLENTARDLKRRATALKRGASDSAASLDETRGEARLRDMTASQDPSPTARARCQDLLEISHEVLSEREWLVWKGVEVEGRTAVEVAAALGDTDSAVRSVLHRAKLKLMAALGAEGGGGER